MPPETHPRSEPVAMAAIDPRIAELHCTHQGGTREIGTPDV